MKTKFNLQKEGWIKAFTAVTDGRELLVIRMSSFADHDDYPELVDFMEGRCVSLVETHEERASDLISGRAVIHVYEVC